MTKGMDDAKAYALAKRLEKYFRDQGHPMAHRLSRRIAEMLAYRVAVRLRTAAALKADTLALALLLEEPGASDAEIARPVFFDARLGLLISSIIAAVVMVFHHFLVASLYPSRRYNIFLNLPCFSFNCLDASRRGYYS